MKILILGSSGQLGRSLKKSFKYYNHEVRYLNKSQLSIQNFFEVRKFLHEHSYEIVINTAAYTKVEESEKNTEEAFLINHLAVENLSKICFELGILLVHFSTDYVFDGISKEPYKESHATSAIGCYGNSKLKGEKSIINSQCKYIIIRTSWLYSEYGDNFLKTISNLILKKDLDRKLYVVNDQIGRPTCASDLANATIHILKEINHNENTNQIFHFCGDKICSWYDFAHEIYLTAKCLKLDAKNKPYPISTTDYDNINMNNVSFRPMNSVLDISKFHKRFNFYHEDFSESIYRNMKNLYKLK